MAGSDATGADGAGFAGDTVQSLMIDVRANTQGFAQDLSAMRGTFNATLVDGFAVAGQTLEAGLTSALAKGVDGFAALRQTASSVIGDIANQAGTSLLGAMGADSGAAALGGLVGIGSLVGSVLGLPGRAVGGPVSPGQPYLVGENGPEVFVPTAAGAIDNGGGGGTNVRVSINVNAPAGGSVPQSLQRSGRQIASAVRRAIGPY